VRCHVLCFSSFFSHFSFVSLISHFSSFSLFFSFQSQKVSSALSLAHTQQSFFSADFKQLPSPNGQTSGQHDQGTSNAEGARGSATSYKEGGNSTKKERESRKHIGPIRVG